MQVLRMFTKAKSEVNFISKRVGCWRPMEVKVGLKGQGALNEAKFIAGMQT